MSSDLEATIFPREAASAPQTCLPSILLIPLGHASARKWRTWKEWASKDKESQQRPATPSSTHLLLAVSESLKQM